MTGDRGSNAPGWHPDTLAVHGGEEPMPGSTSVSPDIVLSTNFIVDPDTIGFSAASLGADSPWFYSRWATPTVDALERKLALLEGGEAAVAFASGMAAASALFLHLLKAGDHLLVSDICYAGVAELARDKLTSLGIEVSVADFSDPDDVAAEMRPNTRLVHAETPCNPIVRLTDIAAIAAIARDRGAELSVDSTIATPVATRPLELGADYVVHSLTKYLCGHGDTLGGAVVGGAAAMAALRQDTLVHVGGALNPFAAWAIMRGMNTLPLRMERHQANALAVARFLEGHPRVRRVYYPGLESHPQHDLARRQMANFSGLVAFVPEDGPALSRAFYERLEVVRSAISLGKQKSLVFWLPTEALLKTSFTLDGHRLERFRAWAGEGIVRFSAGLEHGPDIVADLARALDP
jgi:cystathionine gamma-synthase/methionine-gamma-lyase